MHENRLAQQMPAKIELHSNLPSALIDIFQQYSEIFKFAQNTDANLNIFVLVKKSVTFFA